MTRGDVTEISSLYPGDRFYLHSDRNKIVWVFRGIKNRKFAAYPSTASERYAKSQTREFKEYTSVVFLRNEPISGNEPITVDIAQ
ncbi:hypothetical protein ACVWYG_002567 [Pedobacter sp. UYEF25]